MDETENIATDNVNTKKINIKYLIGGILLAGLIIGLFIYNLPKETTVVHKPTAACELLTPKIAMEFLGDEIISSNNDKPKISGDVATNGCSYSDKNPDSTKMKVIAILVRSGINDNGANQNIKDFDTRKQKSTEITDLTDVLGSNAYFDPNFGQLNILNKYGWIILNYGVGESPKTHSANDAVDLANKIFGDKSVATPTF